jgi:hypothetical protein
VACNNENRSRMPVSATFHGIGKSFYAYFWMMRFLYMIRVTLSSGIR